MCKAGPLYKVLRKSNVFCVSGPNLLCLQQAYCIMCTVGVRFYVYNKLTVLYVQQACCIMFSAGLQHYVYSRHTILCLIRPVVFCVQ